MPVADCPGLYIFAMANYSPRDVKLLIPTAAHTGFRNPTHYWGSLVLLVALNVADADLQVVTWDVWGDRYTLFLNQGTAAVYIVMSSCALLARHFGGSIEARNDASRRRAPWYILVAIGLLNGSANFFMAISLPHTPGLTQTLLNLLGVPLVLILSWLFLRRHPSLVATIGAALIVAGTASSSLRSVWSSSSSSSSDAPPPPVVTLWWAVASFTCAQLFLAGEKVFEHVSFERYASLHPMVMFSWTLCTQFLLGWAVYPIQVP